MGNGGWMRNDDFGTGLFCWSGRCGNGMEWKGDGDIYVIDGE